MLVKIEEKNSRLGLKKKKLFLKNLESRIQPLTTLGLRMKSICLQNLLRPDVLNSLNLSL